MYDDFKIGIPVVSPIDLTDLSIHGTQLPYAHKKIYQDKENDLWMVDCTREPSLAIYITGGLYRLVLEKFAPNEQLFKDPNGKLCLGSAFIEGFISLSDPRMEDHSPKYWQKVFLESENGNLVVAMMILMGETDANTGNIGVIKEKGKNYLGKIDHDHSLGIDITKLSNAATQLNSDSSFKAVDFLQDKNWLVQAFEKIEQIPDALWSDTIKARVQAYHSATHLVSDFDIQYYMNIKAVASHFAASFQWENAILNGDIQQVSKLIALGCDPNKNYSYTQHFEMYQDKPNILPIELAAKTNQLAILEYLYEIMHPDIAFQKKLLEFSLSSSSYESALFIVQHPSFKLGDAEYLDMAISLSDSFMLERWLNQGKQIDFSLLSDIHKKILISDNVYAYEKWMTYVGENQVNYISHLKEMLEVYLKSSNIAKFLMVKSCEQINDYISAKAVMSEITRFEICRFNVNFFHNPTTEAAGKHLFSHFIQNDAEISQYILNQIGFLGGGCGDRSDFLPDYIVEKADNPYAVFKSVQDKVSFDLSSIFNNDRVNVYGIFVKSGFIDQRKLTQDVADILDRDCSDLFIIPPGEINRVYISGKECWHVDGDLLGNLHDLVDRSGEKLSISMMLDINPLFFQTARPIKYENVDKLIGLFAKTDNFTGIHTTGFKSTCPKIEFSQVLDSDGINPFKFIEQCHQAFQYESPKEWNQLRFSLENDSIIVKSEHVVSTFSIDNQSSTVLYAQCEPLLSHHSLNSEFPV